MRAVIFAILCTLLVLLTLLPLSRSPRWWVRALDFPRLQIAAAGVLLLAAELFLLGLERPAAVALAAVTTACVLYQLWWILPYTRPFPNEVRRARMSAGAGPARSAAERPANSVRILAANVLSTNRNADGLIALIRQHAPDIFVTLESNAWWQKRLDALEDEYRYAIKCPLENLYGMHVYSRLPLEDGATQFLVEDDIPSMHANVVLPGERRIQMHFLHPAPPSPTENDESSERDAELLVVARRVAGLKVPVIVTGDLNDVGWSATTRLFRKISGLLDPRIGRGMFNTFHAGHWYMRWPLDHLFHSRHFTLSFIQRLPAFGSDHFPVLVELVLDEAHGMTQSGLDADRGDQAEADDKIAQQPVRTPDVHAPEPVPAQKPQPRSPA